MAGLSPLEKLGLMFLAFFMVYIVKYIFNVLYSFVISPALYRVDFREKGRWALVTGSTDGIGKQYARELAARGCDIVLVSRSLDKLKATAQEIEKDYKVSTKIIQADFSDDEKIYGNIAKEIGDLEIGTLVNNVGMSYAYPEYFLDIPDWEKAVPNMLKINIVSVTKMTHMILPAMVKRGKGVVINIGSASSTIPSPMLTVYAASKAFVEKFTEGIDMEYSKHGIVVQCVLPGFVCSNMSGIRRSTIFAPTARDYVKSAINMVGSTAHTTGYLPHAAFVNILNMIHETSSSFSTWIVTRTMENNRRKALKKNGKLDA